MLGLSFSGSHGASSITKQMQTGKALTRLKSLVTDVFVVHIVVDSGNVAAPLLAGHHRGKG